MYLAGVNFMSFVYPSMVLFLQYLCYALMDFHHQSFAIFVLWGRDNPIRFRVQRVKG